ncbi:penicillin-binding transpeptidase domain-containing protein [Thalassobacillus sp. B23F22_16]|uniref:penicillin-binding transpeptidase domain-containing protein n=1 Tax=Thalassobacillus sp. B23F22_16 TaxID=3459513 RepID=UPI00373F007D
MKKLTVLLLLVLLTVALAACNNEEEPTAEERFMEYITLWEDGKFEEMYEMMSASSKEEFSKEEAVERFEKIYQDVGIEELKVDFEQNEEEEEDAEDETEKTIPFQASMNSVAGENEFDYEATWIKEEREVDSETEENWYVNWNPGFIFPEIAEGQGVGITSVPAERGEIFDRNGNGLAINDDFIEFGVVPGQLGEEEEETKEELAELLDMSVEAIDQKLDAGWVQEDSFVPLKKIPAEEKERIEAIAEVEATTSRDATGRYYPYGEAAAHLTGYIRQVTAEDLEKLDDDKYNSNSVIGHGGLEAEFEETLSGKPGVEVYAVDEETDERTTIAETEVEHGEDIELTVDADVQEKVYQSYDGEGGATAAINPTTGETLALVSSPAIDPNLRVYGTNQDIGDELDPSLNRAMHTFAPGSVVKPITAAIAMTNGAIESEETMDINGKTWSKDDGSWGSYEISRVTEFNGPVDVTNALIRSDNIFFARTALKMEPETFRSGLEDFGFDEEIPYDYPLYNSQISNEDTFRDDLLMANTAYGQGQMEMSVLHLATAYTPFFNEGNLLKPAIVQSENTPDVWKENVTDPEYNDVIKNALRQVVAHEAGTARAANIDGKALAGKTGTAELKRTKEEEGLENGWFVVYPSENTDILLAMMKEDAKSGDVVEQAADLFRNME